MSIFVRTTTPTTDSGHGFDIVNSGPDSKPDMELRKVGLGLLGGAFVVIGLLFILWPGSAYLDPDRFAVGLLFLLPGLIWLDSARRSLSISLGD